MFQRAEKAHHLSPGERGMEFFRRWDLQYVPLARPDGWDRCNQEVYPPNKPARACRVLKVKTSTKNWTWKQTGHQDTWWSRGVTASFCIR